MSDQLICPLCHRTIANNAGMTAHMRAMHCEEWRREQEAAASRVAGGVRVQPATPPPSPDGNDIRWEDPPGRGGTNPADRLRPFVPDLKRNPGKWARCIEYKGPTSAGSYAGKLKKAFPDLQIVGRRVDSGSAVFARYVEEA